MCQKDAFLCAAKGVSVGIALQRKLGTGLFGGEGFIMQKLEGDGMAFVHAGGHVLERELMPGELLKIDTGCIVAFTQNVSYDIQFVGGIKNTLFGGEGVFFATLRGPGRVWIQTYRLVGLQLVCWLMALTNAKKRVVFSVVWAIYLMATEFRFFLQFRFKNRSHAAILRCGYFIFRAVHYWARNSR